MLCPQEEKDALIMRTQTERKQREVYSQIQLILCRLSLLNSWSLSFNMLALISYRRQMYRVVQVVDTLLVKCMGIVYMYADDTLRELKFSNIRPNQKCSGLPG